MSEGHMHHVEMVAEKLRQELVSLHLYVEKFTQDAEDTENRLTELCKFLHNQIKAGSENGPLPTIAMATLRPQAHRCQCNVCIPDKGKSKATLILAPAQGLGVWKGEEK